MFGPISHPGKWNRRTLQLAAVLFDKFGVDHRCERSKLVLTSACEFVQNKLLHHTASNMQAHSDSKVFEYMLSIAVRTWVVREGNRGGNQTATPRRVIRLRFSVVSLTDKCG